MGKYLKYLAFVWLICFSISCEDYLKTESNSTFTEESVFNNIDFATKEVNGIYSNLVVNSMYQAYLGIFYKCDNDIEFSIGLNDGARNSMSHYGGTDGNSTIKLPWNYLYSTIERANICIDKLPMSPIWTGNYAKDAHRLYGEAITLRALCYFELITLWGDVPFSVKSTQAGDDYYLPKTDRDSIYEYLIQDLKNVEDDVPWMRETLTAERINKGFVKGLRARMALSYAGYSLRNKTLETRRGRYWAEYYKIANQECKEIIESGKHQLNPDYVNIFKTIHAYSQDLKFNEVLFEIPFGRLYNGYVGYMIGMPFASSDIKYGKATSQVYTSPYYYYFFDTKDIRRNVSVELYNYNSSNYLGMQRLVGSTGFQCKLPQKQYVLKVDKKV